MSKVLMIAFHFPPQAGSSGLLRSLKYCRYLPEYGWQPVVLTPNKRAYDKVDEASRASIPKGVPVVSSFALDTKKHLSLGGRYPKFLALPDRWSSWVMGGVLSGLRAIQEHRISLIYSTFPIMSAAVIGLVLQRLTGLPWILDLRDPMTEGDYPYDPQVQRIWKRIERACMRRVSRVIFTAEATRQMYLDRYPDLLRPEMCHLISNGFDEADFLDLTIPPPAPVPRGRPLRLVHSGMLYPVERDPLPTFNAVARLKELGRLNADSVRIVFRAPGLDDSYRNLLVEKNIEDIVSFEPHVPYKQALQECAGADGLLLFQAANCDMQIPAKAYEYLRLAKPILALTTHAGNTAGLLREVGGATIVNLASEDEILDGLSAFIESVRGGTHPLPDKDRIQRYTRFAQAGQLAAVLDVVGTRSVSAQSVKAEYLVK